MTKRQLLDAIAPLDDSAVIEVYCTSLDADGGVYAHDVYLDDIRKSGATLVAHYEEDLYI